MIPRNFTENWLDDFFDVPFEKLFNPEHNLLFSRNGKNLMKMDVKEENNNYEVEMDLPGFKKEDVKVELDNGYLTVSAVKESDKENTTTEGIYLRRERYTGACARSLYVGNEIKQDDIKAKFENGTLSLKIPKIDETKTIPQNKYIAIE